MLYYFGRRFVSTRSAGRVVGVCCDNCGCQYYFRLHRTAVGEQTAHYGIGADGASTGAEKQSKQRLLRRLINESEPVPCPKCHWINEDLVDDYRRYRFGGLLAITVLIGLIVVGFSLSIGWYFSTGRPADRPIARFFLIEIPFDTAIIVAISGFAESWLMNRFRPNQKFPDPPKLPRGVPSALLLDESTGSLITASKVLAESGHEGTISSRQFDFYVGSHEMPPICCVCLEKSEPASTVIYKANEIEIPFPLCNPCRFNLRARRIALFLSLVLVSNLAVSIPLAFLARWGTPDILSLLVFSIPTAMILFALIVPDLIWPVRVLFKDARRGLFSLQFKRPEFAAQIRDISNVASPPPNVDLIHSTSILDDTIQATISGERIVEVRCEKCRCQYFYKLARKAQGSSNVSTQGKSPAEAAAIASAAEKLKHELESETEPVPCPKCHWINEQMARDYQKRCYQGCGCLAVVLAGTVSSISLVIGWFLHIGPAADRGPATTFLITIPGIMSAMAVSVVLISIYLRSQVRPNRNYPLPPDVPPETPPALIIDPATGELVPARKSVP